MRKLSSDDATGAKLSYVEAREAAGMIGVSRRAVRNLVASGKCSAGTSCS